MQATKKAAECAVIKLENLMEVQKRDEKIPSILLQEVKTRGGRRLGGRRELAPAPTHRYARPGSARRIGNSGAFMSCETNS